MANECRLPWCKVCRAIAGDRRRRILRVTGDTGPRSRNVLVGLAGDSALVEAMIADGSLRKFGSKRGTTYGANASLRRPRLAPSARRVAQKPRDPAGEAAKRRAAQTPRAALVSGKA